jgi:hypothetical protein
VLPLLLIVYAYKCWWDGRMLVRLRGHGLGMAQLWATPARDLALTGIWLYALFSRTTVWRGRTLRLASGTRLLAVGEPMSPRLSQEALNRQDTADAKPEILI